MMRCQQDLALRTLHRPRRTRGLVGAWLSDRSDPVNAPDHSGNLNHGTIYGASWAAGKQGRALSFDGLDDYVETSDVIPIKGKEDRTIVGWIKSNTATPIDDAYFFSGGSTGPNYHCGLSIHTNTWQLTEGVSWYDTGVSATTNWVFLTSTYNSTTNDFKVYIDGVLKLTQNLPDLNTGSGVNQKFTFGSYLPHSSGWFNGTIDEVRIWNRALSASEIRDEYNSRRKRYGI